MNLNGRIQIAIILNILNAILVVISVAWFFTEEGLAYGIGIMSAGGIKCLRFFTVDSNILAAVCGLILAYYEIKSVKTEENVLPEWAMKLKFVGTTAITVTFMTVVFFLAPLKGYNMLYKGVNLTLHTICPLIAIMTFCFLEQGIVLSKKQIFLGVIPTFIYAIIYLINVIFLENWVDFYSFNIGGFWPVSLVVMLIATYLIAFVIRLLHNRADGNISNCL